MATKTTSEGVGSNPEVPERAKRRRFRAEYKLGVVQEADQCSPGEIGALLRREGLYFLSPVSVATATGYGRSGGIREEARPQGQAEPGARRDRATAT